MTVGSSFIMNLYYFERKSKWNCMAGPLADPCLSRIVLEEEIMFFLMDN